MKKFAPFSLSNKKVSLRKHCVMGFTLSLALSFSPLYAGLSCLNWPIINLIVKNNKVVIIEKGHFLLTPKNGKKSIATLMDALDFVLIEKTYKSNVEWILSHAVHNAIQHGSELSREGNTSYNDHKVEASYQISRTKRSVTLSLTNPKVKEFPTILEGQNFYSLDPILFSNIERSGYLGKGIAVPMMLSTVTHLPEGSYIRWDTNETDVIFSLSIRLK